MGRLSSSDGFASVQSQSIEKEHKSEPHSVSIQWLRSFRDRVARLSLDAESSLSAGCSPHAFP